MNCSLRIFGVLALIFLNFFSHINGQNIASLLNNFDHKARVGLVDEFFERFNGKITNPAFKDNDQVKNLLVLFDQSQFSSQNDERFSEAMKMVNKIINDSISINYSDSTWVALAHCTGKIDGKKVFFDLFLTVQNRGEEMYKWVISKAEGELFSIKPKVENDKIILYPDDHETNFMSLGRICVEQPSNIKNFLYKDFEYDPTSVFAYLVYSGKLKIDYVDNLEFVFTQVPGYMFHIKYFDRKGYNSGWLISNFYEFSSEETKSFLNYVRPLSKSVIYEVGKDSIISINKESIRPLATPYQTYTRRLKEKYAQVDSYINLIKSNNTEELNLFYCNKLKNLFITEGNVHITLPGKSNEEIVSISSFCNGLIKQKFSGVTVDSLYVPKWRNSIIKLNPDSYEIEVTKQLITIHNGKIIWLGNERPLTESEPSLIIYREKTEAGEEWLPLLGDLYVTIKDKL